MVRYLFYTIGDLTYQSPLVVNAKSYTERIRHNTCVRVLLVKKLSRLIPPWSRRTFDMLMVVQLLIKLPCCYRTEFEVAGHRLLFLGESPVHSTILFI